MTNFSNTFKALVKVSGKLLFVIGMVLNICMLFFGFFPSLIYILIMLAGAGMVTISKNAGTEGFVNCDANWFTKSYNTLSSSFSKTDGILLVQQVLRKVFLTILILFVSAASVIVLSQNYFNRRDTIHNCKQITAALKYYKQSNKVYPAELSELRHNNPLLSDLTKDKWGNPYQYRIENNGIHFVLISYREDGKPDTKDDLVFKN
jgi:hypothetical protein